MTWSSLPLHLDMQDVTNSSKIPPNQPSHGEREERTPQSNEGGAKSDDKSVDGDGQECDRGSEETGDGNLDWADRNEQDSVSIRDGGGGGEMDLCSRKCSM